jgi:hypothetical protein
MSEKIERIYLRSLGGKIRWEKFADTKWAFKNRTSKVKQYSRQTKKDKRTNNGQQITTRKTKIEQHELN